MKKLFITLLISAPFIDGCSTPPTRAVIDAKFDSNQTKMLLIKGQNSVRGSALIRQRGGGVVTCAGREVRLTPATKYSSERVKIIFGSVEGGYQPAFGNRPIEFVGEPPEYKAMAVTSTCDAQGFFKFSQLSDGSFYINSIITWNVNDIITEGGSITNRVTVSGGETKEIVLSPK